ncbi:PleD family two-component system response regulator [Streptomyces kaempferi]
MDGNSRRNGSTTVLVVDDVADDRLAMSALLRRAGHEVVPVATAADALRALGTRLREGTLPDVLLVQVDLPDMTGFELCRGSRRIRSWARCPWCTSRTPVRTRATAAAAWTPAPRPVSRCWPSRRRSRRS